MGVSELEIKQEKNYLNRTIKEIKKQISEIGQKLYQQEEKVTEFKKYLWDNKQGMDAVEVSAAMLESDFEVEQLIIKGKYLKKLLISESIPYFGRIDFKTDNTVQKIYVGITYVDKDNNHLVYDWRAPISGMFYDFGIGEAFYNAPGGKIEGQIKKRRQYKIKDSKLIRMFDNDVNVVDDMLQEVLAEESSDKMKNIVNTIQQEQNEIIRNENDRHLIVQGIAGSGKTSVALHRIAFLLYKIENLKSDDVLIFSPNNVFSEYISNVLPELGEENTTGTTFSDFAISFIKGYSKIETFTNFLERYYMGNEPNEKLVKTKLSDGFKSVIDNYVKDLEDNACFKGSIECKNRDYTSNDLNDFFKKRYSSIPLFERIISISQNICRYNGESNGKRRYIKTLYEMSNIERDYKKIYKNLFKSKHFVNYYGKELSDAEINSFVNKKVLNYEDSLLYIYMKGLLESFPYNGNIKQIVIDEAQDYTYLQYNIIKKIFGNANFTILGDVNQTINPYYKYETLDTLKKILKDDTRYMELTKTYRSSEEIIDHTNKILGLNFVSAIRKQNNIPVLKRAEKEIHVQLSDEINRLTKTYKSIAIITKTDKEADKIYKMLNKEIKDINVLKAESQDFNRDLVIVPSYVSKGLEFDAVILYTEKDNPYTEKEKYLYYVVCTRAQHELIIYNQK